MAVFVSPFWPYFGLLEAELFGKIAQVPLLAFSLPVNCAACLRCQISCNLRFAKFIKKYGELEDGHLQAACEEQNFVLGKQRLVGPADAPTPSEYTPDLPIEPPATSELARDQWYDIKFGMDLTKYEGTQNLDTVLHFCWHGCLTGGGHCHFFLT